MQNRTAYWSAYRNVSMAIESWHAGSDHCDTLMQYLNKLERSARSLTSSVAAHNAVTTYKMHILDNGYAPHSCFEVGEGKTCPWHPKGRQVA